MSTSENSETPPLTRRQLRELRNTGATPIVAPQPDGIVDGGAADRLERIHAVADQAAQHVVDAAMLDQIIREHIVGADRQARHPAGEQPHRRCRQRGDQQLT